MTSLFPAMEDTDLLSSLPDFVSFGTMMKASPVEEAGERFVYVEASKESRDQQGEIVLAKALQESASIFKKFGVVDIDHKSMPAVAKRNQIDNPDEWIVGLPVDVRFRDGTTFVKAQLRKGDSPLAARANQVWEGLTKISPPNRYYASVGGSVLGRDVRIDPVTKEKVAVITKTRWDNLALSLQPVNPDLSPAATTPVGVFAKSLNGFVVKALEAGYGTDAAALTGGAALRKQSLQGANYHRAREKVSRAMLNGGLGNNPGPHEIMDFVSREFGVSPEEGAEFTERLLGDIHRNLKRR